jgi:nucleoside-diphosphate-sugar epimerase
VRSDTRLPLMSMDDALRATLQLMAAAPSALSTRIYNVTGLSCSAEEIAAEISRHIPSFQATYESDPLRQAIADSWPDATDDAPAAADWGWRAQDNLPRLTLQMLQGWRAKSKTPQF